MGAFQWTPPPMDTARVIQVIETTILRRGEGKSASDPVRIIRQYWSLDGVLICEVDPCAKLAELGR